MKIEVAMSDQNCKFGIRMVTTHWACKDGGDDYVGTQEEMIALVSEWKRADGPNPYVNYSVIPYNGDKPSLAIQVGDVAGTDVHIIITSVTESQIEAEVISVDTFWTSRGFQLGETLKFRLGNFNCWVIDEPLGRPWFILSVQEVLGEKLVCFEHYR